MKKPLTDRDLMILRQRGLILAEETAHWYNDELVIENILTKQQRILENIGSLVLESQKRILKG